MFAHIDINQIKKLTQKEFDQFYELEGWSSTSDQFAVGA